MNRNKELGRELKISMKLTHYMVKFRAQEQYRKINELN